MPDVPTFELSLDELHERYLTLHTAAVFDVLDTMGLPYQLLGHDIQPLRDDMVVAGPAVTSKSLESADPSKFTNSNSTIHATKYVFDEMYPGCVLVKDVGYSDLSGPWGENTSITAQVKGCVGVIIDGLTRDHRQVVAMGYPVFARGVTPSFGRGRQRDVETNVPVRIAGHLSKTVTVYPGDFIFGDKDGIMVVPQELTVEVLLASEKVEEFEEDQRRRLLAGEDRREVYKNDRYAHVRRLSGDDIARLMLR